ncbi:MAG: TonB-dependent receptor, partial [Pseudomonadota bacterium]
YDAWNLKVLLGLRYSESDLSFQKQTSHSGAPSPNPRESSSANKWIPRVGVIWSANDTVDFFASYGESFNPQFNVQQGENGAPLTDPETGQQVEAGMRLYPFNGDLSVSLTAYELTKQNVVRSNPDVPNTSLLDGEQRSRGVELDIAGSLSDAIDLYLSYAYTDTEIVQGANDADTGAQFTGIPKNKLVAWADWEFWNGYSVAYGLDYQDDHNTDLAGAAVIDGRTLHELRLRKTYVLEGVDLNVELAARNLTDEVWYQNATNPVFIKRGEPRSFFATLRADF